MYIHTLDPHLVGKIIAAFRRKRGLSQEVVSGLADLGRSHLSAIERGERMPTLETLYRICTALNVKMSDVVTAIEVEIDNQFLHS